MWVSGALMYYVAVRWIHYALDAGPLVLIVTALVGIFTIGLGDEGNADGISAYSVFNRGFQRLLGTVEAEELVAQQMGGGMRLNFQQQQRGNRNFVEPQPPPARQRRAAAQQLEEEAIGNDEGRGNDRDDDGDDDDDGDEPNNNNNDNQLQRRLPGKKARRRNLEQRRELRRQREAALAMGFGADEQGEALAMQRLLEEQIAENARQDD